VVKFNSIETTFEAVERIGVEFLTNLKEMPNNPKREEEVASGFTKEAVNLLMQKFSEMKDGDEFEFIIHQDGNITI